MTTRDGSAGLRWTGHALVDVGIAGVCAHSGRRGPGDLTLADLDAVSDFMEKHYYEGKLGPYLSCVFMNASFVQPNEGPEKRTAFVKQYLRGHRASPLPEVAGKACLFSGVPATSPLVRTHLPLFSGEGVMNFRPDATTSVPAAGAFVVALMFLPMASRRAEGKLLAVLADDPDLTLRFARKYLEDNRRLLALALPTERALVHEGYDRERASFDDAKKQHKYADAKGPRSLVVADLTEIAAQVGPSDRRPRPTALTAYLMSNSGRGPSLELFYVPSGVVSFVKRAAGASTREAWTAVVERFNPLKSADETKPKGRGARRKGPTAPGRAGWSKNPAFEDLCAIFESGFTDRKEAARWLRRYVLGRIDVQSGSSRYDHTRARSWSLASLFLEEVLGMREGRINAIRGFADKLAESIHTRNDRKLYRALAFEKLHELRHSLLRAQRAAVADGLLFGLDEYSSVWLHEEGDEYLVRDLVCIRVVERLYELGYYAQHAEDVLEGTPEDQEGSAEEVN